MTGPTRRTSYADLMAIAAHHIASAATALSRERLPNAAAARANVEAYWQLLGALRDHAWQLAGGVRRTGGVTASVRPEPLDAAAVRFIDALGPVARHRPSWDGRPDDGVGSAWASATTAVRAASDLLSTHRDQAGVSRTPDADTLDYLGARAAGLAGVADIASSLLAAQRDLMLRAGQAGVPWAEVGRRLPDLEPARLAARDLVRLARVRAEEPNPLGALVVAHPAVRTDDPLVELGDRILRLRQTAWQLTHEPYVGMQTLTDFAAAAVIVHTHVGAYLGRRATGDVTDLASRSMVQRAQRGRAAWSLAHLETRSLRTSTPGLRVVRADLLAVRDLCQRVLPMGLEVAGAGRAGDPRRVRALANGSIRAFTEIAGRNADVLKDLGSRGQVYISGHQLTGDQVCDDPSLVEAKLHGRLIPASLADVRPLDRAYGKARAESPDHTQIPAVGDRPLVCPVEALAIL